jgi:hypothetical protein
MKYIIFEPREREEMPPTGILEVTFHVGHRFRCTMTMDVNSRLSGAVSTLNAQWEPDMPRRLSKTELADYRRGRDTFYARVANIIGGRAMIAEM